MVDQSLATQQVDALQQRMLADIWRSVLKGTVVAVLIGVVMVPALYLYSQRLKDVYIVLGALVCVSVLSWVHYFLTKYRMRKGYFGDSSAEVLEIIEFLNREQRNKR